jgi:hypothetical protein
MQLDSAFQLQEHLKALHYIHTKPANATHTIPINRTTAALIATPPNGVDRALWLYELCRFLINKCNDIIVGFLFDNPPCSATTCPEMRASEWQFLCAVHESPKSCCAIDYCCHTLDWATNIVTSQKIFPSRLSLSAGDSMDERGAGVKHLVNIFRRLHRIFAHAWFQHREVFWRVEGQTGLYVLFKTVCDNYELLPAENYKLPPEAEGLEPVQESKPVHTILKPDLPPPTQPEEKQEEEDPNFMGVGRTNTRRHIRSSPSTGSAVTTVPEADEDDTEVTQKLVDMHIVDNGALRGEKEANSVKEEPKLEIEAQTEAIPQAIPKPILRLDIDTEIEAGNEIRAAFEQEAEPEAEATPHLPVRVSSEDHHANMEEPKHEEAVPAPQEEEAVSTIPVVVEDATSTSEEKEAEPEYLLLASEESHNTAKDSETT